MGNFLQVPHNPTFWATIVACGVLGSGMAIVFTRGAAWPLSVVLWAVELVYIAQPWSKNWCGKRRDVYNVDDTIYSIVPPEDAESQVTSVFEREQRELTSRAFNWIAAALFFAGFAVSAVTVFTLQFADERENTLWAPYGFCAGFMPFLVFALVMSLHDSYEAGLKAGKTQTLHEPLMNDHS